MSEEKDLEKHIEELVYKYMPRIYTYKGMRPKADIPEKGEFGDLYATSDTKEVYIWQPIGTHWNILSIQVFEECLMNMVKTIEKRKYLWEK